MIAVDTIDLEVNWVEIEEFTILEMMEVTTVGAEQSTSCLGTNVQTVLFQILE